MSTAALYKLTGKFKRLMDLATDEDNDPELGLSNEFAAALESLTGKITTKFAGCCKAVKSMAALKGAIDDEIAALRLRSKRLERGIENVKDYIQHNMEVLDTPKLTAGLFKLTVCRNSQPTVTVLDLEAVPVKFDKPQERQLSLTAIRDAVKAGEEVPGVDVATGSHLRIS